MCSNTNVHRKDSVTDGCAVFRVDMLPLVNTGKLDRETRNNPGRTLDML